MIRLTNNQKKQFCEERDDWRDRQPDLKIINQVRKMVRQEDWDFIFCLVGRRGCGKSTFAIVLLMLLDPFWTPWDRIGFTALEIMRRIRDGKPGWGIFWDEIGQGWDALRFMSTESVESKRIFQMVRMRNYYFGFTAPTFKDIATPGRRVCNLMISLSHAPRGRAILYRIWINTFTGEIGRKKIRAMNFVNLPDIIYDTYNKFKNEYVVEQIDQSIEKLEVSKVRDKLTRRQYEMWYATYQHSEDGGLTFSELASMFNKSTAKYGIKVLKRIGYLHPRTVDGEQRYFARIPTDIR